MDYLENSTFDEIAVGATASLTRTLTEKDIQVFAIMSGDINPAHVDVEFAKSDLFHKIIGHGMWGAALISTVLGTQLPGPGTIYVDQSLHFKKPVTVGDTLTVTVIAIEKNLEKKRIVFSCECRNQKQEVVINGQAEVIAPAKKIRRPKILMPEISLRRPYSLLDRYIESAKSLGMSLRAGVIQPVHPMIIQAVHAAHQAGLIDPVFIGPETYIQQVAKKADIDLSPFPIVNVEHGYAAISKAITMAREGRLQLLIRGGATRADLLRALQKPDKGLLTDKPLSHATILEVPTYHKALILTDTLINIDPVLEIKRALTQSAINFSRALGIEEPKVAILAGTDTINVSMRSTIDAAALCKMAQRAQIRHGIVDGPLTFDTAISAEVAQIKGIHSAVAGDADILVMPNLETANILVKQLEYLAESHSAGLVLGGRVPVLMSHIDEIRLSTVSCALAILDVHYQKQHHTHQSFSGEPYGHDK